MMTVSQVSELAGVSVRTLQYYDKIGLLEPSSVTEAGYRLYDDTALERLEQILLFRELEFPLKDIQAILDSPGFDREKALSQQIKLLEMKRQHLDDIISFARGIKLIGVRAVDLSIFNTSKIEEYKAKAREEWGDTDAYKEYSEKAQGRSPEDEASINERFMNVFAAFGQMRNEPADSDKVQAQVGVLKDFITENFYTCTNEILSSLGNAYASGGEFTENIDKAAGKGTASFTAEAIAVYCKNN